MRPDRRAHHLSALADPRHLRQMIDAEGGFTVRLRTGEHVGSGISVALRSPRSMTFCREAWSDRLVTDWMLDVVGDTRWRSRHIGGWLDPRSGAVWLDVVHVMPAQLRRAACVLGRIRRQHCVFDLSRRETVVLR